ncbi:hypothetical protein XENOCAPTIV_027059 [Xenoophorus captivus]|uniref:Uncharacterized protein n=1 Tax=Xenoophorus captivus TaxID=1517983 RepID=A0ABV0RDQ6_9TELE
MGFTGLWLTPSFRPKQAGCNLESLLLMELCQNSKRLLLLSNSQHNFVCANMMQKSFKEGPSVSFYGKQSTSDTYMMVVNLYEGYSLASTASGSKTNTIFLQ